MLAIRVSPRLLILAGSVAGAAGMVLLTRVGLRSHYATTVLPGALLVGLGLRLVSAPVFSPGSYGVRGSDDLGDSDIPAAGV